MLLNPSPLYLQARYHLVEKEQHERLSQVDTESQFNLTGELTEHR